MTDLLTLSKQHPDFHKYLDGTFSKTVRALPIQSLNVDSINEQVTFQLVKVEEIKTPLFIPRWAKILRLNSVLLVAFPLFLVLAKNWMDGAVSDPISGVLAAAGAMLLFVGVNLRNDYVDHMRGLDRIHPQAGSQAIQKGWITAKSVNQWAITFAVAGFLLGLPAVVRYLQVLWPVVVLTVLAVVGLTQFKAGRKLRRWSEFSAFLLIGPLLTFGFQTSLGAKIDWEVFWLGAAAGWLAVFHIHLKNFLQLMVNTQGEFRNTVTGLGFEKAKHLLLGWWAVFLLLFNSYHFVYASTYWAWAALFASGLSSFATVSTVLSLKSPVGSGMQRLESQGRWMLLFVVFFWFVENLWYLFLVYQA